MAATEPRNLTSAQQQMLVSQNLHPDDALYNAAFLFLIDGRVDPAMFAAAFRQLVADADALRTVIRDPLGTAQQVVQDTVDFELPVVDLSKGPDPETRAMVWARAKVEQPFDIEEATFDSALLKLADDRFAWFLNQHHLVTDARSVEVLFRHLEQLYVAAVTGASDDPDPLPPFSEYLDHEAQSAQSRKPSRLSVVPPELYGRPTRAGRTDNRRVEVELSAGLSDQFRELLDRPGNRSLTEDLGLLQLFTTATFAWLKRVSGQETITIAATAHNRTNRRFARVAGLFMELFPIEVIADDDETFASLHPKVQAATLDYLRLAQPGHSDPEVNRHLNVVLNYHTAEFAHFAGHQVTTHWLHPDSVDGHHQLRIWVFDFDRTGRFTLAFDVSTDLLNEYERHALAAHFQATMQAMVTDWEMPIGQVDLLSHDARDEVLALAGDRANTEAEDVVEKFARQVAEQPGAVAIRHGERVWSYADLDRMTEQVASGITPDTVIGVALPRSAEAVIAMLGSLRAGAAFVPIDPDWPVERIQYVAADADCATVITEVDLGIEIPTISLDDLIASSGDASRPVGEDPARLAYILYTSGSTGQPKGTMIERRSLANYISWAAAFYGHGLAFPLFTPLTFDLTITSIFTPLATGGSMVVYPPTTESADLAVLDVFAEDVVDIVKLTPSHLSLLADHDLEGNRIRQLILGGEDLPTATAARIAQASDVVIHNEYGPTEATVGCIVHTFDRTTDTSASVPIGRPISGMRAYVLDEASRPVPMGVPGELWLAGAGLARGYVGRPELTESSFRPIDGLDEPLLYATGDLARFRPDGTIEYLGRRDDQVKIRGVRAELGEIEAALVSHPDVTAVAARLWEPADTGKPEDVIHCTRCGLASDYPGVSFDAERVCNECRAFDDYRAKAMVYFKPEGDLLSVLASQRGERGTYDCISLLSGGKDSTYVLCRLVDLGLRVLAVTLDNGYLSDQAKGNIDRVVDALGVDHRYLSTPAMNEIFVDSLQRHGNVCNGCFKTIYTLSMQTALDEDIPYIVTGLSRGQFFETRLTADLFTELTVSSDQIDANVLEARKAYHGVDDAVHRLLDVSMFDDEDVFESVQFVDFYRYVDVALDDLYAYLDERVPWVRPTDTGRSTNCRINDVGIYYHRKFRGHHNYSLPYSWDVRLGHKTRQDALEELDDDIDVTEVARILDEIGFPEDVTGAESVRTLVAYYTASEDIPVLQLKKHMEATLPRQLIPSKFMRLDAIPLTQNGKVDRAQLPSPDEQRPELEAAFVAPHSENELILARIWEQALGVSGIGARDNYFDLGGDSIAAVQIIARAHRAGLPITMHQLTEELTIENLAAAIDRDQTVRAKRIVGNVDLTPVQHWFFDGAEDDPAWFHHAVRVALPDQVDLESIQEALDVLVDHHDALRQSFRQTGDTWESSVAEETPSISLEVVELEHATSFDAIAADSPMMRAFDLKTAPLMRGYVLVAPGARQLLLVAHHLIVDAVSWSHLIDDLGHLTAGSPKSGPSPLPAVTSSVRDWTEGLQASARDLDLAPWKAIAAADSVPWPSPEPGTGDRAGRHRLDAESTRRVLARASQAGLGVDEVLIAELATSLVASLSAPQVRLFLEGHGRESDSAQVDVTRTMGWFTSLYPVLVQAPDPADSVAAATAVRNQIRGAYRSGRDYGVLRYLHPSEEVRAAVSLDHGAHLVFNYLGRVSHPAAEPGELVLAGPIKLIRPPALNRIFGGEVNVHIEEDALLIDWTTHEGAAGMLDAIVEHMVAQLRAFGGEPAAVDEAFSLAGLDRAGMANLASILQATEDPK